jgi:hypothetical protein
LRMIPVTEAAGRNYQGSFGPLLHSPIPRQHSLADLS